MKKLLVLTVLVGIFMFFAGTAMANLTAIGDPVEGNSWSHEFNASSVGSFDLIAVMMTSADTFEAPTFSGFTDGSWSVLYENDATYPTLASASGNAVSSLNFWITFEGSTDNSFAFDFVAFNGQTLQHSAHAVWNSGWTITAGNWNPSRADVIPAPGALLLGSMGAGFVGWLRRRRMV